MRIGIEIWLKFIIIKINKKINKSVNKINKQTTMKPSKKNPKLIELHQVFAPTTSLNTTRTETPSSATSRDEDDNNKSKKRIRSSKFNDDEAGNERHGRFRWNDEFHAIFLCSMFELGLEKVVIIIFCFI